MTGWKQLIIRMMKPKISLYKLSNVINYAAGERMAEITKEVFDVFFKENYCEIDYRDVKKDFEAIADRSLEELFTDETDITKLNRRNFVIYLQSDVYCEFEDTLEEVMDAINPEVLDAVMDVSTTTSNGDEITGIYWETKDKLRKDFLGLVYDAKIAPKIAEL